MSNPTFEAEFDRALRLVCARLKNTDILWALTGSTSFALQGVPVAVHDIDIQTDAKGAYAIEDSLSEYVTTPVSFSASDRIRSHFGSLLVGDVPVEIMGDLQKRLQDGSWEPPVDIRPHRRWVPYREFVVPVLTLEYEAAAYRTLGRLDRAALLERFLKGPTQQ